MAESTQNKRGPGRPPGSKNKTKTDHASGPSKREQIDEMQRRYDRDRRNVDIIWSITLVAIGLFLFFTVVMDTTGSFGMYIHDFCLGMFGVMAYALPFLVFVFAILLLAGKLQHIGWRTVLFSFLIFMNLCVLNSYRYIDESDLHIGFSDIADQYRNAVSGVEGGVIGMEIGGILVKLFGKPGLVIIALTVLTISIFLVANTPISRFVEKAIKNREKKKILDEMNAEYEADLRAEVRAEAAAEFTPRIVASAEASQNARRKGVRAVDLQDTIVMSAEEYEKFRRQQPETGILGGVKSAWRSLVGGLTNDERDISHIPSKNTRLRPSDMRSSQYPAHVAADPGDIPEPFSKIRSGASIAKDTASMDPITGEEIITPDNSRSRLIVKDKTIAEPEYDKREKDTFFGKLTRRITGYVYGEDPERNFDAEEEDYGYPGDKKRRSANAAQVKTREGYGLGDPDEIVHSGAYGLDGHPKAGTIGLASDAAAEITTPKADKASKKRTNKTDHQKANAKDEKTEQDADDAKLKEEFNTKTEDAEYELPPVSLLKRPSGPKHMMSNSQIGERAALLEKTLNDFGVEARVINVTQGASVTRYEVQPATGVKVSRITRLADDIALNMRAKTVRIEAPIPGKAAVGIEVENKEASPVLIRELIDSEEFVNAESKIEFVVGKDISGNNIVADMKDMPHLLVAGATGSGKSVCINSIITSFLYKAKPSELKLIMIDPKMVELGNYNGIPHMLTPVVTDPRKAARALAIAVEEMEKRYELFSKEYVKELGSYNEKMKREGRYADCKPEIIIIIDELADLMMAAPNDVENAICRLAQKARAAGMHLIVATQRPSVDVVTGLIKANIPSRIAFTTTSSIDSRTILDTTGAEKLLGKGDMLFSPVGSTKPFRVQGPYISSEEIEKIIKFVKKEGGEPAYDEEIKSAIDNLEQKGSAEPQDDLTEDAIEFIFKSGQASVSMLQRRFRIGYNRAARIIDEIEEKGIIGPPDGARPRQVLISEEVYYGGQTETSYETEISDEYDETYEPEDEYDEDAATEELVYSNIYEDELPDADVMDSEDDGLAKAKQVSTNTGVNAFNSLSPEQQAKLLDADYEDEY